MKALERALAAMEPPLDVHESILRLIVQFWQGTLQPL